MAKPGEVFAQYYLLGHGGDLEMIAVELAGYKMRLVPRSNAWARATKSICGRHNIGIDVGFCASAKPDRLGAVGWVSGFARCRIAFPADLRMSAARNRWRRPPFKVEEARTVRVQGRELGRRRNQASQPAAGHKVSTVSFGIIPTSAKQWRCVQSYSGLYLTRLRPTVRLAARR